MKGIRIRPELDGMRSSLFDLEAEIMEIVWSKRWSEFCVHDVHDVLKTRREIAYTTVMTTISRLFTKDLLSRHKQGRRYMYVPTMTRTEFIATMTREVLSSLPPVGQDTAMEMLVEHVASADIHELDRLETLIRKARGVHDDK